MTRPKDLAVGTDKTWGQRDTCQDPHEVTRPGGIPGGSQPGKEAMIRKAG